MTVEVAEIKSRLRILIAERNQMATEIIRDVEAANSLLGRYERHELSQSEAADELRKLGRPVQSRHVAKLGRMARVK